MKEKLLGTPKRVVKTTNCIYAAGILLAVLGCLLDVKAIIFLGIAVLFGGLAVHFRFYKCPSCGEYLGRDGFYEFCPRCGAKLPTEPKNND